jgi:hypothetical protein
MAHHRAPWPVAGLWEGLEVRRRGFYAAAQRQAVLRIKGDEVALLARVQAMHAEPRPGYGRRRMAKP